MGRYVSPEDIENFLQVDIKSTTTPSTAQVEDIIGQVDAQIDARRLGNISSDVLIKFSVLDATTLAKDSIAWFQAGLPPTETGLIVVPPMTPFSTIVSGTLSTNKAELSQAENWDVLAEGPGASTDFIILKKRGRNNKHLGYALYFYSSKAPSAGYDKLRGTFMYGYDVDSRILGEYAKLKVSEQVIVSTLRTARPLGLATYTGGDMSTFVNTQFAGLMEYIRIRAEEIEMRHFPEDPIGVAVM